VSDEQLAAFDVQHDTGREVVFDQVADGVRDVRSRLRVTATTRVDASVPGSGAIIYGGSPPQVTTSVTGSGAITRG